jgi:hypothetical protein
MLKGRFPIRVFVGVVTFLVLMISASFLFQQHAKKQAQKSVALTKKSVEALEKRQLALHTSQDGTMLPDKEVSTKDYSTSSDDSDNQLVDSGDSNDLQNSDEVDMSLDQTSQDLSDPDKTHQEWLRRRAELSQRTIELSKESELLSQAYLDSVDNELSLMNSFLANISDTEREIARQALLRLYPNDTSDLNEFFDEIDNAQNLSPSEISERAKELMTSRETREVMRQQHDARWEQLRAEMDEFYGDELSQALEQIKSEHSQ